MKSTKTKLSVIILATVIIVAFPLIQSFIFNISDNGAIEINKEIEADFIKSDKKIVLLFFGYVGCQDVCTPVLQKLSDIYESEEFKSIRNDVDVFFVNLTPEVDRYQPDLFAKYFNKSFHGVYLTQSEILSIDRRFGLYFSRGLSDTTELNHTDYIYMIQNAETSKMVKKMYSVHPIISKKLIDDIISLKTKKYME